MGLEDPTLKLDPRNDFAHMPLKQYDVAFERGAISTAKINNDIAHGGFQKGPAYGRNEKINVAPRQDPGSPAADGKHQLIARTDKQMEALKEGLKVTEEQTTPGNEAAVAITYGGNGRYGVSQNYTIGHPRLQGGAEVGLPRLTSRDYQAIVGKDHGHDGGKPWSGSDYGWSNRNQLPSGLSTGGHGYIYLPYFHAPAEDAKHGDIYQVY